MDERTFIRKKLLEISLLNSSIFQIMLLWHQYTCAGEFPRFICSLEINDQNIHQSIRASRFDSIQGSIVSFKGGFHFGEEKKLFWGKVGAVGRLGNRYDAIFRQVSVTTKKMLDSALSWSSFKFAPIYSLTRFTNRFNLFNTYTSIIDCLSFGHKNRVDKGHKQHYLYSGLGHASFHLSRRLRGVLFVAMSFGFGVVLERSTFILSYDIVKKLRVFFNVSQKIFWNGFTVLLLLDRQNF